MSRKSFILHLDSLEIFDELTNEQAGILFKAIKSYNEGKEIELDFALKLAFLPFKKQFERDAEKYEKVCERNKNNGSKGGRPKEPKKPKKTHSVIYDPKKADNDNDNDNDSDSDSDNKFDFKKSLIDYGFEKNLVKEWIKIRKTKKATNSEIAFKRFIKQVELNGADKNYILEEVVAKSWQSFESEWLKPKKEIKTTTFNFDII